VSQANLGPTHLTNQKILGNLLKLKRPGRQADHLPPSAEIMQRPALGLCLTDEFESMLTHLLSIFMICSCVYRFKGIYAVTQHADIVTCISDL
jgi:hypothetical protein